MKTHTMTGTQCGLLRGLVPASAAWAVPGLRYKVRCTDIRVRLEFVDLDVELPGMHPQVDTDCACCVLDISDIGRAFRFNE